MSNIMSNNNPPYKRPDSPQSSKEETFGPASRSSSVETGRGHSRGRSESKDRRQKITTEYQKNSKSKIKKINTLELFTGIIERKINEIPEFVIETIFGIKNNNEYVKRYYNDSSYEKIKEQGFVIFDQNINQKIENDLSEIKNELINEFLYYDETLINKDFKSVMTVTDENSYNVFNDYMYPKKKPIKKSEELSIIKDNIENLEKEKCMLFFLKDCILNLNNVLNNIIDKDKDKDYKDPNSRITITKKDKIQIRDNKRNTGLDNYFNPIYKMNNDYEKPIKENILKIIQTTGKNEFIDYLIKRIKIKINYDTTQNNDMYWNEILLLVNSVHLMDTIIYLIDNIIYLKKKKYASIWINQNNQTENKDQTETKPKVYLDTQFTNYLLTFDYYIYNTKETGQTAITELKNKLDTFLIGEFDANPCKFLHYVIVKYMSQSLNDLKENLLRIDEDNIKKINFLKKTVNKTKSIGKLITDIKNQDLNVINQIEFNREKFTEDVPMVGSYQIYYDENEISRDKKKDNNVAPNIVEFNLKPAIAVAVAESMKEQAEKKRKNEEKKIKEASEKEASDKKDAEEQRSKEENIKKSIAVAVANAVEVSERMKSESDKKEEEVSRVAEEAAKAKEKEDKKRKEYEENTKKSIAVAVANAVEVSERMKSESVKKEEEVSRVAEEAAKVAQDKKRKEYEENTKQSVAVAVANAVEVSERMKSESVKKEEEVSRVAEEAAKVAQDKKRKEYEENTKKSIAVAVANAVEVSERMKYEPVKKAEAAKEEDKKRKEYEENTKKTIAVAVAERMNYESIMKKKENEKVDVLEEDNHEEKTNTIDELKTNNVVLPQVNGIQVTQLLLNNKRLCYDILVSEKEVNIVKQIITNYYKDPVNYISSDQINKILLEEKSDKNNSDQTTNTKESLIEDTIKNINRLIQKHDFVSQDFNTEFEGGKRDYLFTLSNNTGFNDFYKTDNGTYELLGFIVENKNKYTFYGKHIDFDENDGWYEYTGENATKVELKKEMKKNAVLLHYQKVEDYRLDLLDDMDSNKENNTNGGSKTNKIKSKTKKRNPPSIKKYRKHNRNKSIRVNKRKHDVQ
jgi:colicin import membrane protein